MRRLRVTGCGSLELVTRVASSTLTPQAQQPPPFRSSPLPRRRPGSAAGAAVVEDDRSVKPNTGSVDPQARYTGAVMGDLGIAPGGANPRTGPTRFEEWVSRSAQV